MERIIENFKRSFLNLKSFVVNHKGLIAIGGLVLLVVAFVLWPTEPPKKETSTVPVISERTEENQADIMMRQKKAEAEAKAQEEEKLRQEKEEAARKELEKKPKKKLTKKSTKNLPKAPAVHNQPSFENYPPAPPAFKRELEQRKKSTKEWNNTGIEFNNESSLNETNEEATDNTKYSPERTNLRGRFLGKNTGNTDLTHVLAQEQKIPVIIEEEISTAEAGGRWSGRVSENIYGRQGNIVLIPIGSTVLGTYGTFTPGTGRLKIHIIRIVTPKGDFIFQGGESYGQDGILGVPGLVDNKYFDRYGIPALISLSFDIVRTLYLGYADSWLQSLAKDATQTSQILQSILNSSDRTSNAVIADVIRRQLQIEPVITLERGTLVQVRLMNDVVFQKNGV